MNNPKIKIIFAGTGSFSSKIFESFINNSDFEIVALISQPNKAMDRNKKFIETPVAQLAKKHNIKLFQPTKIKEIYEELLNLDFDYFITAAFGQFIPNSIIKLAKKAALNVHGSLLEKYRGAAPIQHALLNNDKETGISLIYMIDKMDAGNVLFNAKCSIESNDTALEIYDKLAQLTIDNLPNWLKEIYINPKEGYIQKEELVTFASKINNEDCELFYSDTKQFALNKIRAFNDQPGAFIMHNNKRLKIFRASMERISTPLSIEFSDGKLYLIEYQIEGKQKVKIM